MKLEQALQELQQAIGAAIKAADDADEQDVYSELCEIEDSALSLLQDMD